MGDLQTAERRLLNLFVGTAHRVTVLLQNVEFTLQFVFTESLSENLVLTLD